MPVNIPNTTATGSYQNFGLGGVYSSGYLFVANGLVDVLYYHGLAGLQQPAGPFTLSPGLTPLQAGYTPDGTQLADPIAGLGISASQGLVSSPAQQFFGALFEPGRSSISAGAPFAGSLSPSGQVTPVGATTIQLTQLTVPIASITGTSFATGSAIITPPSSANFDGTLCVFEFFCPNVQNTVDGDAVRFSLADGGVEQAELTQWVAPVAGTPGAFAFGKWQMAPTAGAHTFEIIAWVSGGSGTVSPGAGGAGVNAPAYLWVTRYA